MKNANCGLDPQAKAYFNSLPALLQEQIVESGVKLCTKEELEAYAKNALNGLETQKP